MVVELTTRHPSSGSVADDGVFVAAAAQHYYVLVFSLPSVIIRILQPILHPFAGLTNEVAFPIPPFHAATRYNPSYRPWGAAHPRPEHAHTEGAAEAAIPSVMIPGRFLQHWWVVAACSIIGHHTGSNAWLASCHRPSLLLNLLLASLRMQALPASQLAGQPTQARRPPASAPRQQKSAQEPGGVIQKLIWMRWKALDEGEETAVPLQAELHLRSPAARRMRCPRPRHPETAPLVSQALKRAAQDAAATASAPCRPKRETRHKIVPARRCHILS